MTATAGLTTAQAKERLAADGPNELVEGARVTALGLLAGQFKSIIVWILIAASVISGFLGDLMDAGAILAVVILNAAIGFYQEYSAEQSIAALRKMSAPHAKVRRDGQAAVVLASEIVSGDLLLLEAGDLVAADATVARASSLKCMEAALTGEPEAVEKSADPAPEPDAPLAERNNAVFMGTSVVAGTGEAVVAATGMKTELGKIAGMISEAGEDQGTPLQRKLDSLGKTLMWVALGIVALLFGLGMLRQTPWLELFNTSISLAVAAVPEGLPAVVTVALSLGVTRMARRGALMRKLSAVETLGSTNVICTDKTGTLTKGEMTARALYVDGKRYEVTGEGYGPEGEIPNRDSGPLLELGNILVGSNNAQLVEEDGVWKTIGDPTEGALLSAGLKAGADRVKLDREWPRHREIPFDSDRKRSATIRKLPDEKLRAMVNGAPGPLVELCQHIYSGGGVRPITQTDRDALAAEASGMAKASLRVLGSAYRDLEPGIELTPENVERDLVFVGYTGMYDPPRAEAKAAIAHCHDAGIQVVMITGDHPDTAATIARELGIAPEPVAVTGVELDRISDEELRARVKNTFVYARVTAAHKMRIVGAWKANDAVVAMTGDGVNDAPAIKNADIGIAMGRTGTEVTKQAADMILTDDNFATIAAAVEEGRGIYGNIRKTLQYLLAGNTGELLLMTVCVAAGLPAPLLPIHLLWINLVTDGLPALCLATDPLDPDTMLQRPRPRSANIADAGFLRTMLLTGLLTAAVSFAVFLYYLQRSDVETARGAAFAALVFAELFRSFGVRSETKPVWRIPLFTNPQLLGVVALSFGLQVLSQENAAFGGFLKTTSMPFSECMVLVAIGGIPMLLLELWKVIKPKQVNHS